MKKILTLVALVAFSLFAWAFSEQTHTVTIGYMPTDGQLLATIPQLDPAVGTLDAVEISYRTMSLFRRKVENLDVNASTTVTLGIDTIDLNVGDGSDRTRWCTYQLVSDSPSFTLPPFDGTLDYGGGSGITVGNVDGPDYTDAICRIDDPNDLAYFAGTGTAQINLDTVGIFSGVTGGGNISWNKTANCGASVYLTYYYH